MSEQETELFELTDEAGAAPKKRATKKVARKAAKKAARKSASKKVTRKSAEEADLQPALDIKVPVVNPAPASVEDVPEQFSTDGSDPEPEPIPEAEPEDPPMKANTPPPADSKDERDLGSGRRGWNKDSGNKGPHRNHPRNQPKHAKGGNQGNPKGAGKFPKFKGKDTRRQPQRDRRAKSRSGSEESGNFEADFAELQHLSIFENKAALEAASGGWLGTGDAVRLETLYSLPIPELNQKAMDEFSVQIEGAPVRHRLVNAILDAAFAANRPLLASGIVDLLEDGDAVVVFEVHNYRIHPGSVYLPKILVSEFSIKKGTVLEVAIHPRRKGLPEDALQQLRGVEDSPGEDSDDAIPEAVENELLQKAMETLFPAVEFVQSVEEEEESSPYAYKILSIMGKAPEANLQVTPFEELIPYYPTERILLETDPKANWDNTSMRVVDLLTPVGLGQRGLIVAPPRTGKTILQQAIANAVAANKPEAKLIILLIDERPEEVTDFRRQITRGEVIASTFDERPENHVHCAEMVIEKARRMVEAGEKVIILLDSITRLARAYNALAANSGKILSGGVEANALQRPKRFFGSARNIEGGGSLTILGTALVETGSRMDEVIFEEFKGTGNMELHLDRALSDKRVFPAIEMAKSGTRKEELLYHPDEMHKVYGLRRAMKGVPPTDAMEMLINRIKKTTTNIQFLMGVNS